MHVVQHPSVKSFPSATCGRRVEAESIVYNDARAEINLFVRGKRRWVAVRLVRAARVACLAHSEWDIAVLDHVLDLSSH